MIIEISVAVIAVVLAIFILYMVSVMKTVKETLVQANQTLLEVRKDLSTMSLEATQVLHDSNLLINDVHTKLNAFDPILTSVSQAGQALTHLTGSVKQVSAAVSSVTGDVHSTVTHNKSRISQAVEITKAGLQVWKMFQSVRQSLNHNGENKKE
jgi:uncharacterized protein YoxC